MLDIITGLFGSSNCIWDIAAGFGSLCDYTCTAYHDTKKTYVLNTVLRKEHAGPRFEYFSDPTCKVDVHSIYDVLTGDNGDLRKSTTIDKYASYAKERKPDLIISDFGERALSLDKETAWIKYPLLICRIFKIYIQPIIDYGSMIWNQDRIMLNNNIMLLVKKVTRIALNITYTMEPSHYICFEKRCAILNIDLPNIRRMTQEAIFGLKIIKGELKCNLRGEIEQYINER